MPSSLVKALLIRGIVEINLGSDKGLVACVRQLKLAGGSLQGISKIFIELPRNKIDALVAKLSKCRSWPIVLKCSFAFGTFQRAGPGWARKDQQRDCVESSTMQSADFQCHIEWPAVLIRRLPKARRGPGFQRLRELPQLQVLVVPDQPGRNGSSVQKPSSRRGMKRFKVCFYSSKSIV